MSTMISAMRDQRYVIQSAPQTTPGYRDTCRTARVQSIVARRPGASIAVLLCVVVLAAMVLIASTPAPAHARSLYGGVITGVVSRKDTGRPLAGAEVNVYGRDASGAWSWMGWSTTTESGYYVAGIIARGSRFECASGYYGAPLGAGAYRVRFDYSGGGWRAATRYYKDSITIGRANDVAVRGSRVTPGVNGRLLPLGHVTGVVRDQAGKPLPSQGVTVFGRDPATGLWEPRGAGYTSASGYYDAAVDAVGAMKVRFADPRSMAEFMDAWEARSGCVYFGGATTLDRASPVSVTPGAVTSGIGVAMLPGGHITGRIVDVRGEPRCAQVFVWERNRSGGLWSRGVPLAIGMARSDASGYYDIGGLGTGEYSVSADAVWPGRDPRFMPSFFGGGVAAASAKAVTVAAPRTTSGINILAPVRRETATLGSTRGHTHRLGAFGLAGKLSPGSRGDKVRIEVRMSARGRWRKAAVVGLDKKAVWRLAYAPGRLGTYYFRVVYWGARGRAPVTSRTISVVARR